MSLTAVPAADLGDEELMVRVQADQPDAFGELFDRFGSKAYRVAYAIGHNGTRAEDIVQDAFLSIWRARADYEPQRGSVNAWVIGIVRNRALDSLRRHWRHDSRLAEGEHILDGLPAPGSTEQATGERHEAAHLRSVLAQLPAAQSEVIALAYFGELSTTEIATELALPLGTVKGRMRLGLERMRPQVER